LEGLIFPDIDKTYIGTAACASSLRYQNVWFVIIDFRQLPTGKNKSALLHSNDHSQQNTWKICVPL